MSLSTPAVDTMCPGDVVQVGGEGITVLAVTWRYVDYETSSGDRRQITPLALELWLKEPGDG